jgi:hypothetical protein
MIYMNPEMFETLSEEERNAVFSAHDAFQAGTKDSGELVGFAALADPSNSSTVRVRDGVPAVTDGQLAPQVLGALVRRYGHSTSARTPCRRRCRPPPSSGPTRACRSGRGPG